MKTGQSISVTEAAQVSLHPELANYLDSRRAKGLETYGCELVTFNGRDALLDALEEAADLYCYLTQATIEGVCLGDELQIARGLLISLFTRYSETGVTRNEAQG